MTIIVFINFKSFERGYNWSIIYNWIIIIYGFLTLVLKIIILLQKNKLGVPNVLG